MSFKYAAVQVGPSKYVLAKMGAMCCDVVAFLSPELYEKSEEDLWRDAVACASIPGAKAVFLMPDTHKGYVLPIGGVLVTEDVIAQAGSGYDISCFTEDTKVPLADGRVLSFGDLVAQYGAGGDFYVYSITPEGRVTVGQAHSPRKIREYAALVEVELDNGERISCTPDHLFVLRDGTECEAGSLLPGTSLMPLYRTGGEDYCSVQHPADRSFEQVYKVSFREVHGYIPEWPQVIHHDIFREGNPNPSKRNDDPRFLVEMNQKDHFDLHSRFAKERLVKGEIWGAKAHKLYPKMYSAMGSANMKRLHADPAFQQRHAKRMSETNRKVRERGGYNENWAQAGERGRPILVKYNQSTEGRAQSRLNGLKNAGRKASPEARAKMREASAGHSAQTVVCPHCNRPCKGPGRLKQHLFWKHDNHKVVAVRPLSERRDVYCLTVEKYHNFALDAGVFVHNCGVVHMRIPGLHARDIADFDARMRWVRRVEEVISLGSEAPKPIRKVNQKLLGDVFRHGAKALGIRAELCERSSIPVSDKFDEKLIELALERAPGQLGSVGGGNHFVELQCDAETGEVWLMVHCGSRSFGWRAADYFFKRRAEELGLPHPRREEAWVRLDEEIGQLYWAWHNAAANYAVANRHLIASAIADITEDMFGARAQLYYEISHNLVQRERLLLPDGSVTEGFVHRKGATRAFPAGHPDLAGTIWEDTGHPCLIPGSMFTGAAVLFPREGARSSGNSVNHGSGRLLSREGAKKKLRDVHDLIDDQMRTVRRVLGGAEVVGIATNGKRTPLDECDDCYKPLDKVLGVLEDNNIAEVRHRLYPVANLKGADNPRGKNAASGSEEGKE